MNSGKASAVFDPYSQATRVFFITFDKPMVFDRLRIKAETS